MIHDILSQLTEAVTTNGVQDTERGLEELRSTLKEVERERYKIQVLYMCVLYMFTLLHINTTVTQMVGLLIYPTSFVQNGLYIC